MTRRASPCVPPYRPWHACAAPDEGWGTTEARPLLVEGFAIVSACQTTAIHLSACSVPRVTVVFAFACEVPGYGMTCPDQGDI